MTKDKIKELLGKRIKNLRKKRNLTQEKLAEMVGIGTSNISYFETGKFVPSIDTMCNIANALGVEIYELYMFNSVKSENDIIYELSNAIKEDSTIRRKLYEYYTYIK